MLPLLLMETITESIPTNVAFSPDFLTNVLGLDVAVRNIVPSILFQPEKLSDLRDETFQKTLIQFIKRNPDVDFVYNMKLPKYRESDVNRNLFQGHASLSALPDEMCNGIFIGGSSALISVQGYFKGNANINWKSNDVDVFYLNCKSNSRMNNAPGNMDWIFCKEKTIEDVLLNFDLPCCRVGYDFKYNYYISAQALVAILTGKMYLPEYFKTQFDFEAKLNEYEFSGEEEYKHTLTKMIINRFYERVKKYQSRGFKSVYTHLDYILPWVKNRFTYVVWERFV